MVWRRRTRTGRRRWWQHLIRALTLILLLLAAAYVLMPWWLPTGWLRDRLAADLSAQMGVSVEIDEVRVSWAQGLEIRGLRIYSTPAFDEALLVEAESIGTDFSPLQALVTGHVDRMRLVRPILHVRIDEAGNSNLPPLGRMTFSVEARHISVRDALGVVHLPDAPHPLHVAVQDAQLSEGAATRFGRITVSAGVEQARTSAPLTLRANLQGQDGYTAASMNFAFSNVELGQLMLVEVLGLPLRNLSGACNGSLYLHLDNNGVVDRLTLSVGIADLNAQPKTAVTLPVIRDAGLEVQASYDPITQRVDVDNLEIRMPGLDVSGRMVTDVSLFEGRWEALRTLELSGQVRPMELAALVTGRAALPGDLRVDGPVLASLSIAHSGNRIAIRANGDATGATISRGERQIKPAGLRLRSEIVGEIDDRLWRLEMESSELQIGPNSFAGRGAIPDLRVPLEPLTDDDAKSDPLSGLTQTLAAAHWEGGFSLADLPTLDRLLPAELADLSNIQAHAPIEGQFTIGGREPGRFSFRLDVPAEARMRIGLHFVQPEGSEMGLSLRGRVLAERRRIENASVRLYVANQPAAQITDAQAALPGGADQPLRLSGDCEITQLEKLLETIPRLADWRDHLAGRLAGRLDLQVDGERYRASLDADVTDLRVDLPGVYRKAPGQRAGSERLRITARSLADDPAGAEVTVAASTGAVEFSGAGTAWSGDEIADLRRIAGDFQMQVRDVGKLVESFPAAEEAVAAYAPRGRFGLTGSIRWSPGRVEARLEADSDLLTVRPNESGAEVALHPARLALRGAAEWAGPVWSLDLERLSASLAGQQVEAFSRLGHVQPNWPKEPPHALGSMLRFGRVGLEATLSIDPSIASLHPPVARWLSRHDAAGTVRLRLACEPNGDDLAILGELDATQARLRGLEIPLPSLEALGGEGELAGRIARIAGELPASLRFRKLAGVPARIAFRARGSGASDPVELEGMVVRLGDLSAELRGTWTPPKRPGEPVAWPTALDVAAWTDNAAGLAELLPATASAGLTGRGFVSAMCRQGRLEHLTVRLRDLSGTYRGKRARLSGELRVRNVAMGDDGLPRRIGGVSSEGLEFQAGPNHAWILFDMEDLLSAPSGEVAVLATYLKDRELMEWLVPPKTQPAASRARYDAAEDLAVADGLIHLAADATADADVRLRMQCRRLITWDDRVREWYDVRNLSLRATLREAKLHVDYEAGLDGGRYTAEHTIDLNADRPALVTRMRMRDVIATEEIQPQLDLYFPGNTVLGYFNRKEHIETPLRDEIVALLDSRHLVYPVGSAKTVTTDGIVIGRAAPQFIADLFPGLNLARYRYRKMTGFAGFQPDGTAVNDMIFDGERYDIYMRGTTDRHNIARYEVGLLLLGGTQSPEWHHAWRQGRLPIFKVRAKIVSGRMVDQEVSYPWPNETIGALLIRDSIFYRMWVNWRKE